MIHRLPAAGAAIVLLSALCAFHSAVAAAPEGGAASSPPAKAPVSAAPRALDSAAFPRLSALDVLAKGYPRAFFFRQTEGLAAAGELNQAQWAKRFDSLNGIMGKALDEELPGRSKTQPYFTQFKQQHPTQAVMLHYNGNGRDPRFLTGEFFAGHWLYYNGCRTTSELRAGEKESTVAVEDFSLFKFKMGRFGDKNEDLVICALGDDGKPDWRRAEQVELLSGNGAKQTLTLRRGAFGTKALAFAAGKAYVAAHATRGPWGKSANLLWVYNHATTCPKDEKGRTCNDVALADLERWFGPGGELAAFDGLEFDAAPYSKGTLAVSGRGVDADGDGKADNGWIDGINVFGIGIREYHVRLRKILGEDRLIMADGGTPRSQRSIGILNGIESEGWPGLGDSEIIDWSGGLNRHFFWRDNALQPALNYINHKFNEDGDRQRDLPLSRTRLVLAAAVFTDSAFTYALKPPGDGDGSAVWDELAMGAEQKANWLGMPVGETIRIGLEAPDLLKGAGVTMSPEFVSGWKSQSATVSAVDIPAGMTPGGKPGKALKIEAKSAGAHETRLTHGSVQVPQGDLLIYCRIWAAPMTGYPEAIPRMVWLGCEGAEQLISAQLPAAGACVRGGQEGPLSPTENGAQFRYVGQKTINKENHEAFAFHPPMGSVKGPGYVFWEREVSVPASPSAVEFYTGLDDAKGNSDGIAFSVIVKSEDGAQQIFESLHTTRSWQKQSADLTPWSGQSVTLRFVADSGPKDSSTADHGVWGDVYVVKKGAAGHFKRSPYTPGQIMTLANATPFLAGFYFRDAGPGAVDLTLDIENAEPIYIADFTAHNAPDAMAREFEHGVVLANPSMHEVVFELGQLFPGAKLRRLKGTSAQDQQANNGEPVGATVTLGARDGLFLVKQ